MKLFSKTTGINYHFGLVISKILVFRFSNPTNLIDSSHSLIYLVSEEEIISFFTQIIPYIAATGAVVAIIFKTLNYFLRRSEFASNEEIKKIELQQKDREIELEKQKLTLLDAQKEKELYVQRQLKKLETLLFAQKYYLQAVSSAMGLREHLSDEKLREGIKPFFRLWEFFQRRQSVLNDVGFYFFSQRKAESLVQLIEKSITDEIRDKISSSNYTRLEQLKVTNIDQLEEKCNSDPKIKEICSKFSEFMNGDLESFKLHLELYAKILLYLVNDMFKDWYQEDVKFAEEQQHLRDEINVKLKTDNKLKEFQLK